MNVVRCNIKRQLLNYGFVHLTYNWLIKSHKNNHEISNATLVKFCKIHFNLQTVIMDYLLFHNLFSSKKTKRHTK